MPLSIAKLEIWFITSLAHASLCHRHTSQSKSSLNFWEPGIIRFSFSRRHYFSQKWQHHYSTYSEIKNGYCKGDNENQLNPESHTKEELLELVDQYNENFSIDYPTKFECGTSHHQSEDPNYIANNESTHDYPSALSVDPEAREMLERLKFALKFDSENLDLIFEIYRSLPNPRAKYLDSQTRHKLLHVLAVVEFKGKQSMLRYLSVVNDLKVLGIPLSLSEWNSAISFTARYLRVTTALEVETALRMWKEMEHSAGVKGDGVTFQILFDVACRAGKFALAEMIYREMAKRGLEFTRYHFVAKIMFYGRKQDGDGVRAMYRELIEAGEIVDTVVLNAVISALIKAREPDSAENLYRRMKSAHLARANPQLVPADFMGRRSVNKALLKATQLTKNDKLKRDRLQERSIIAPDSITYLLLIEHFSVEAGNLDKTVIFLEEMKWFALPVRGVIFVKLFRGFYAHGGVRYTSWTCVRLELVYKSFLKALDSGETETFIAWWIVLWLLKAFEKCTDASRTLSVWEDLKTRWEPQLSDMEHLTSVLDRIISQNQSRRRMSSTRSSFFKSQY
ncbi:putative pentatricopeptide repeat protein [Erysiphe necator]|uniref:Putative pentatricopeptide repeat protein n=1 Tax=Uncinula necator TaxID=52586 RepID=A0A0B1PBI0_UNCNE|nr:putative pentatricopeptide repeat protein [Erysiphe necator]